MWGIRRQREGLRGFSLLRNEILGRIQGSRNCSSALQEEMSGKAIGVELLKESKEPSPPPPDSPPPGQTRYTLYVANLAFKARNKDLREFFAATCKPPSVKVVFNNNKRNAAGYGFVSYATREEAETAISDLNGKEFLGRTIDVQFKSPSKAESIDESASKSENTLQEQPEG
ncbi:28 kDa ribonucleoprotein [Heracleum sosnowskyi]|uniref:28 kDa ribonucleoprotein n=1 Tax=Heracleum sosnowskyi TaxID=360622 RepID=A0AAD8I1X2_9APIA|nr:28 kDa ribonucleoprotein [Heracleum sosnowskyi]